MSAGAPEAAVLRAALDLLAERVPPGTDITREALSLELPPSADAETTCTALAAALGLSLQPGPSGSSQASGPAAPAPAMPTEEGA